MFTGLAYALGPEILPQMALHGVCLQEAVLLTWRYHSDGIVD